jgi:glutamate 5-kinase
MTMGDEQASSTVRARVLGGAKRLVVKLGSSLLAPEGTGVRADRLAGLAAQVAELRAQGREVVLVSSGAIASGMRLLKLARRPDSVEEKQALAAVGQPDLMRAYAEAFAKHGLVTAQVLLTQDDLLTRKRFQNARKGLLALLGRGIVAIVNENDMVAVDEIRLGDNDLLSAHVAVLVNADALILLTDVDGLHTGRPGRDAGATRIDVVAAVTAEIRKMAGHASGTGVGSGGMSTKVQAAEQVTRAGHAALIARGTDDRILLRAVAGEPVGTLFLPAGARMPARKRVLAFGVKTHGVIVVDAGARTALVTGGKSLLPKGVVRATGGFKRDEAVSLQGPDGAEFARGLAGYSAEEVNRIKGLAASEIAKVLGVSRGDEVVHRDRLVLLTREG